MKALIRVSYSVVTHESAEVGDCAETGWVDETGTEHTLREAVGLLRGMEPSSTSYHKGVWYSNPDHSEDFLTGARTERAYHIDADERFQRRLYHLVTSKMIGIFR